MVVPVINFNGVSKVMFANTEYSKVYCGSKLVWERKAMSNSIVLYTSRQLSMYSKTLFFEKIDPRITKETIKKIVLMDKYEINGDKVGGVVNGAYAKEIRLTSDLNTLTGINEFVPYNAKVEVYLK